MGYSYSVYAVDLKKLKPTKDEDVFDEILEANEDEFADNFESFSDEIIKEGAPLLQRALWELLRGKFTHKDGGFQYGYALEILCRHFGKRIENEELTWFDEFLDPYLKKARCPDTEAMLGRGTLPMKMPMPNDFPEIGTITPAGCIAALGAMATIRPLAAKDDTAIMVIDEITGWFETAKKKKCGLVTFIY